MIVRNTLFGAVSALCLTGAAPAADSHVNLHSKSLGREIVVVVSNRADDLQQYAASELVSHVQRVTGVKPKCIKVRDASDDTLPTDANFVVLGRADEVPVLKRLADALQPKKIIPIHTFHPDKYSQVFQNVTQLKDGEVLEL